MVYYKPIQVTIEIPGLAKVIINVIMRYYGVSSSIITNQSLLFILKFWFLLCYFLKIKKKLFIAFYSPINGQTKRQNSIMKAYFRVFVNWKQDDWTKLLLMAKFAYNNAKNASINHILFKLNCSYYPRVSFKENVNPYLRFCSANKLVKKLRELIEVCC